MFTVLLTAQTTLAVQLLDPGVILFGFLLALFSSALTLTFLLKDKRSLYAPLMMILIVIEFLFVVIIFLDFANVSKISYSFEEVRGLSDLFATHRLLLFQLPVLLITTAIATLLVYRENILEKQSHYYYSTLILSVVISFVCIVVIAFESLI